MPDRKKMIWAFNFTESSNNKNNKRLLIATHQDSMKTRLKLLLKK